MIIMAIIRTREIPKMETREIRKRLAELKLELAKERGQISVGGSASNTGRVKEMRKTIARLLTQLNTMEKKKGGSDTGRSM